MKNLSPIIEKLKSLFPSPPDIALVLGSGLGGFASELQNQSKLETASLPGYPHSTVQGHKGLIVSGVLAGKRLVCFEGRIHLYEGYSVEEVVLPVNVAAALGAKNLILTNASGGIRDDLKSGSLMLIEDQIDLQFRRRTRPDNLAHEGMSSEREKIWETSSPYSERLNDIATSAATNLNMELKSGSLGSLLGPTYETPAEIRMEKTIGVDAVCMSTVAEAAEGARLGMEVLGISCVTNRAAGLEGASLNHREVIEVAAKIKDDFISLLKLIIEKI